MDVTHVPCGQDGWGHWAAVIDSHDREVIGYTFALRGRANEAERAVEAACLARFGTLQPAAAPVLRSDNGLIFQSRRFRTACRDYRLQQEFITPDTPEQNGLIERFFQSFKEECVWPHQFQSFTQARTVIGRWLHWYNEGRPHQALGYRSPRQFPAQQPAWVARFEGSRIVLLGPQLWVKRVFARYRDHRDDYPGTGSELARHLLDRFDLSNVKVETTEVGDYYDPLAKVVRLTPDNYHGKSLTAVTVAAHEVGHALRTKRGIHPFGNAPALFAWLRVLKSLARWS